MIESLRKSDWQSDLQTLVHLTYLSRPVLSSKQVIMTCLECEKWKRS